MIKPYTPLDRRPHRGLTLIELMVALAIISVLAGIALPTLKNSLKGQKLSRSSSLVKASIEQARARSISRRGGGGIIIDRLDTNNVDLQSQAIRMRLADAPSSYSGEAGVPKPVFGISSTGAVSLWFHPAATLIQRSQRDIVDAQAAGTPINEIDTLINIGDIVQIDGAGIAFRIFNLLPGSTLLRTDDQLTPANIPDVNITQWVRVLLEHSEVNGNLAQMVGKPVSFTIRRRPRAAIAPAIELPSGTTIDLTASGIGRYGNDFSPMEIQGNYINTAQSPFSLTPTRNYQSIYILFDNRGAVSRVLAGFWNGTDVVLNDLPITGDIHLLIGEIGQIKTAPEDQLEDNDPNPLEDEADDGRTPLLNPESIWVTIRARSGEVFTSSWVDPTDESTDLIPAPNPPMQRDRILTVIGRVRSGAVQSQDLGSQ